MARRTIHPIPILQILIVRPRLAIAALVACVFFFALPESWRAITKLLLSWDLGTGLYLALTAIMMGRSDEAMIRRRAASQDDGGLVILGFVVFGAIASLAAIMNELVTAKGLSGHAEGQAIALAAATVFLSWLFMQTAFAVHYAHEFYNSIREGGDGGLEFPLKYHTPDYWDFVYFSFVIGTAAATADINLSSKTMRRIVTLQCVIVFFFNTSILALAINVGAGLA
jgi:uncharacterized membrane protein